MSIGFKLGRGDHKKVEDFLARRPTGVNAITVDPSAARHQQGAAEAATDAGVAVLFDPGTERLADTGFHLAGLPYLPDAPYDLVQLESQASARALLVDQVVEAQPAWVTTVTPPHFWVRDESTAHLNVALAEATRHATDRPVRAVLLVSRTYAVTATKLLIQEYRAAGITAIELRVSPFGGEDEGLRKVSSVFALARAFTEAGFEITLGLSGNLGQTAVALGHVAHYSVGIGMHERVDQAATLNRQRNPPAKEESDEGGGGPTAGIYLPGAAATLPRPAGRALLANTSIRTRIGCRIGTCGTSVEGPGRDPREHYLHARAQDMSDLLAKPPAWRAQSEMERLRRALALRQEINEHYLGPDVRRLKTRTLESLIDDIIGEQQALSA